MIRENPPLQEQFGDLSVPKTEDRKTSNLANGHGVPNGVTMVNVIESLLGVALEPASSNQLDLRLGACECIKAFFTGHSGIRSHVLRRAIDGFKTGSDNIPNILLVLLEQSEHNTSIDPYQRWIAAVLLFHLLYDNSEAKAMALGIAEGDSESGEELVTCIQLLASTVMTAIKRNEDSRISVSYLMLLSGWLFEDPDAVNDLLGEASIVQSLINGAKLNPATNPLVSGLSVFLLGIIYEFSSKDSPVPRKTLHGLLIDRLGREQYLDKLKKLRANSTVRDFEVLAPTSQTDLDGALPEVYFDGTFIEFFKDNFSRIVRAIDRDPGIEVSVIANGVEKGVSRDLVDSLKAEVEDRSKSLRDLESEMLLLKQKLEQEQLDHRKTRESSVVELGRIKHINESLQRNHEDELQKLEDRSASARNDMLRQHQDQLQSIDSELRQFKTDSDRKANKTRERNEAEIADLKTSNASLSAQLDKADKDHIMDLQTAHGEYASKESTLGARAKRAEEKTEEAEERLQAMEKRVSNLESAIKESEKALEEKEKARQDVQTELDDLLIVFGDLETKRSRDKV